MSFVISAIPFMQVDLTEQGGGPVEAFLVTPTARTRSVMNDHSIIFRGRPSGFSLHYLSNPEAGLPPVAQINGRTRFSFAMRLVEADFFEHFHPIFPSGAPQLLLDNLDSGGVIQPAGPLSESVTVEAVDALPIGPNPYPAVVDVSGGAPNLIEAIERFKGAVVGSTEFEPEPAATTITIPLEISPNADPAVRLTAAAPSTLDRIVYVDGQLADAGAAGVIDLFWDQPQTAVPANSGAVYEIVFRPRP
jgi:hypothetical protein